MSKSGFVFPNPSFDFAADTAPGKYVLARIQIADSSKNVSTYQAGMLDKYYSSVKEDQQITNIPLVAFNVDSKNFPSDQKAPVVKSMKIAGTRGEKLFLMVDIQDDVSGIEPEVYNYSNKKTGFFTASLRHEKYASEELKLSSVKQVSAMTYALIFDVPRDSVPGAYTAGNT